MIKLTQDKLQSRAYAVTENELLLPQQNNILHGTPDCSENFLHQEVCYNITKQLLTVILRRSLRTEFK